jgi:hypothetical protein
MALNWTVIGWELRMRRAGSAGLLVEGGVAGGTRRGGAVKL